MLRKYSFIMLITSLIIFVKILFSFFSILIVLKDSKNFITISKYSKLYIFLSFSLISSSLILIFSSYFKLDNNTNFKISTKFSLFIKLFKKNIWIISNSIVTNFFLLYPKILLISSELKNEERKNFGIIFSDNTSAFSFLFILI